MRTRTLTGRAAVILVALSLLAALAAGCGLAGNTASEESVRGDGIAPAEPPVAYTSPELDLQTQDAYGTSAGAKGDMALNVPEEDRMIIRSKTLRLEVESTPDAVAEIRTIARARNAVVTGLQVATDDEGPIYRYDAQGYSIGDGAGLRGWVTVRVPAADFEAFVDDVSALGTVKYQAEGTEDVTQQHIDLSARLENLRAQEVRLREFFDKATKVEEMLSIERELARVRGDIESLDAQVKYLERQAAMATVTIELVEPKPLVRPDGDTWGFGDAITSGIRGAAGVLTFGLSFIIATSPLWGFGIVVFFVVRTIWRRRRRTRGAAAGGAGVVPVAEDTTAQDMTAAEPRD